MKLYFVKIALRNISRHKSLTFLNIFGLSIGITACLMIGLYVKDELSYDKFNINGQKIYQVGLHGKIGDQEFFTANTCPPMASALVREIPEVEAATRIAPYWGQVIVKAGDKAFSEQRVFYADSNFFSFFSYHLIEGDIRSVLTKPNSIVLTRSMADKYFGTSSALEKTILIGNENTAFTVTGICDDSPSNSHFHFDFLLSSSSANHLKNSGWFNNFLYTYFLIHDNESIKKAEDKTNDMAIRYAGPEMEKVLNKPFSQIIKDGGIYTYYFTPLFDIHLNTISQGPLEPGGNVLYVKAFACIAVFILILACINFTNMTTAGFATRAKEVSVKKTLGSQRGELILQFLTEAMLYSLFAMCISFAATAALLPAFNSLTGKFFQLHDLVGRSFLLTILLITTITGFLAGSYPAIYLTSFNAAEVIKGKVTRQRGMGIQRSLVIFQFAISIFLIIATVTVFQQLRFMSTRNMGIDQHQVMILENVGRLGTNVNSFRDVLVQNTAIEDASFANNQFPGVTLTTAFRTPGSSEDHIMQLYQADYNHQQVLKFEILKGRYFSKDFPSDSTAIVLNETAVKEFGWDDPLNKEIIYNDGPEPIHLKVIGVYRDFNYETLKEKIRPLAISLSELSEREHYLFVRYNGDAATALSVIENLWKKMAPNEIFQFRFLDQNYENMFRAEQRAGKVFTVFAGISIFISCLGLFALAAFTASQRKREIGVRKIFGASAEKVALLIANEFSVLVLVAFVPAAVAGWYFSEIWLEDFVYRVGVNPFVILWSGFAALLLAWITVSFHTIKAAMANPVKSLRHE